MGFEEKWVENKAQQVETKKLCLLLMNLSSYEKEIRLNYESNPAPFLMSVYAAVQHTVNYIDKIK